MVQCKFSASPTCFWVLHWLRQMVLLIGRPQGSPPWGTRACPPLAPRWSPAPQSPPAGPPSLEGGSETKKIKVSKICRHNAVVSKLASIHYLFLGGLWMDSNVCVVLQRPKHLHVVPVSWQTEAVVVDRLTWNQAICSRSGTWHGLERGVVRIRRPYAEALISSVWWKPGGIGKAEYPK